jgi:ribosomal protein S18 acetylase RimI-like enzyme
MAIATRPAIDDDCLFARVVHHQALHDVVVRQFGPWNEQAQDTFFIEDWKLGHVHIILCDGMPCGYTAVDEYPDFIALREIHVLPKHQNRGIGSTVLREILDRARTRRVPVKLGTCHVNHRAAALYHRLGFRDTGQTETHRLMQWDPPNDSTHDSAP